MAGAVGFIRTSAGRWLFERDDGIYKSHLEAGDISHLRPFVRPGSVVIDVGANVGFFTRKFAGWVSDGGKVLAIEPEPVNVESLRRTVARAGLNSVVEIIEAVAAESEGEHHLVVNPDHPGDHRIGETGLKVRSTTIDSLVAWNGWQTVSLMKIDVQGAEELVLVGAEETLERFHPALFVEVDDNALRRLGSNANRLLDFLWTRGYLPHRLNKSGVPSLISFDSINNLIEEEKKYFDILFIVSDNGLR